MECPSVDDLMMNEICLSAKTVRFAQGGCRARATWLLGLLKLRSEA